MAENDELHTGNRHEPLSRLLSLSPPVAIAHRGGAKLRPENTMAAFEHALTLGVDGLECDVRLSGDGDVVVVHDETLERTTDAEGPVSARTADELSAVDAGFRFGADQGFPFRGAGVGIPRLSQLLERSAGVPVIVEIKGDDPRSVDRVLGVIREARATERVVVGGFSHAVIEAVRRQSATVVTSGSEAEVVSAIRRAHFFLPPRRTGFRLFQVPLRLGDRQVLTRSFVRVLRRAGIPVQAWIIDEPDEMRMLLGWGVSGLISDRPDTAVAVVKAWGIGLEA